MALKEQLAQEMEELRKEENEKVQLPLMILHFDLDNRMVGNFRGVLIFVHFRDLFASHENFHPQKLMPVQL